MFSQNFLDANDIYGIATYEAEFALTVYGDGYFSELDGMNTEDFRFSCKETD